MILLEFEFSPAELALILEALCEHRKMLSGHRAFCLEVGAEESAMAYAREACRVQTLIDALLSSSPADDGDISAF